MAKKEREVTDRFSVHVPLDMGTQEERSRIAFNIGTDELSEIPNAGGRWKVTEYVGDRIYIERTRFAKDEDDEGEEKYQWE